MLECIVVNRRDGNNHEGARVHVRPSMEVVVYLDDLAKVGIHGKTRSQVAKTLVGSAIDGRTKDGILRIHHSTRRRR